MMLFAFGAPPECREKPLPVNLAFVHHHHHHHCPDGTATFSFISYRVRSSHCVHRVEEVVYDATQILQRFSVFASSEDPFGNNLCVSSLWLIFFWTPLNISQPVQHKLLSHHLWLGTDFTHFPYSPQMENFSLLENDVFSGTTIDSPQIESWLASVIFDLGQDLIRVFMCSSGAGTAKPSRLQRMFANWTHLLCLPSVYHANQKRVHFSSRFFSTVQG